MIRTGSIGFRIGIGFTLILLFTVTTIATVMVSQVNQSVSTTTHQQLQGLAENLRVQLDSKGREAMALSSLVANMPEVQRAMADGDRQRLLGLFRESFLVMKKEYGVRQFQFHTPPAISYLRVHKPQKFGDDLASFRQTVVETNATRQPLHGLEKGVAGIGVRGIVPIAYQGRHLGSVEFGMSFGQSFFDEFKALYGVDVALYLPDGEGFKPFATTYQQRLLPDELLRQALSEGEVSYQTELEGRRVVVLAKVIGDYSGKPMGLSTVVFDHTEQLAALASARNTAFGIGLGVLLLGLLVVYRITRSITRPIDAVVVAMGELAAHNLTVELPVTGNNELTQLAIALNRMVKNIQSLIGELKQSTDEIGSASRELSDTSNATSREVNLQSAQTEQAATALNQMNVTAQQVATSASFASQSADAADAKAKSGREVVAETISSINRLSQVVNDSSVVIQRLQEDSANIGTILDVIRGIADQTNLLALNAAIEAARAGEQGRGFAVVADEVRSLAKRTQESTEEIQGMIEHLQEGAGQAVVAMEASQGQANDSVLKATQAGASLDAIITEVVSINEMTLQIAAAAEQQSAVVEELNKNVASINDATYRTVEGANQTSVMSEQLAGLSRKLDGMVTRFRT